MYDLFPAASAAAMAHAESEYPKECVGVISLDGEYIPLENVSPNPETTFCVSEADDFEYVTLDENGKPRVAAMLHSQCYAKGEVEPALIGPSREDMQQCLATKCTWGLIPCIGGIAEKPLYWGEFLLDTPLLNRPFIPQVTDCCNAIRSFYWQIYGIHLHECPRDWDWWHNGGNLYEENFKLAGFEEISMADALPGDVVLAQLRSPVPNHAVVLLDAGLMYHHPQQMLSVREPIGRWRSYAIKALRHKSFNGPPPMPPTKLSSLYGDPE
jgi:proteasome lid subunit RPN8/RPN11